MSARFRRNRKHRGGDYVELRLRWRLFGTDVRTRNRRRQNVTASPIATIERFKKSARPGRKQS